MLEVYTSFLDIIIKQQEEINKLNDKLAISSENSSLPPSVDFKRRKKKKLKKSSGKKIGAQQGHKGVTRAMAKLDAVDKIVDCDTPDLCICGNALSKDINNYTRHQVYDICTINKNIILTEYRQYKIKCLRCSLRYKGELPDEIDNTIVGNELKALIATMVGDFNLSKAQVVKFLDMIYGLKISIGTVSNTEARISASLKAVYDEAKECVQAQEVLHCDETRHKENNKTNWAWVATNDKLTLFMLDKSRGKKSCKKLIGENYAGILITDRYAAYNIVDIESRQLCWAHLKRDFARIAGRSGIPGRIGDELLALENKLFKHWHNYKAKAISFATFSALADSIQKNMEKPLEKGVYCTHQQTSNTCKNILKSFAGLWIFTEIEGIEPTNNLAERKIRPFVIYRKLSFGTKSERGTRYIERLFSVLATIKQQSLKPLVFIKQAIVNYNSNIGPPELLSVPTT